MALSASSNNSADTLLASSHADALTLASFFKDLPSAILHPVTKNLLLRKAIYFRQRFRVNNARGSY